MEISITRSQTTNFWERCSFIFSSSIYGTNRRRFETPKQWKPPVNHLSERSVSLLLPARARIRACLELPKPASVLAWDGGLKNPSICRYKCIGTYHHVLVSVALLHLTIYIHLQYIYIHVDLPQLYLIESGTLWNIVHFKGGVCCQLTVLKALGLRANPPDWTHHFIYLPQLQVVFQPSFFRGYVKARGVGIPAYRARTLPIVRW